MTSKEVTYTFDAPYIQYNAPRLIDFDNTSTGGKKGVYIRYESQYDSIKKTWLQTTPAASSPTMQTAGHQCWVYGIAPSGLGYPAEGCEHFGIGVIGSPTATVYRWLVADPAKAGNLTYHRLKRRGDSSQYSCPHLECSTPASARGATATAVASVVKPVIHTLPALLLFIRL